MEKQKNYFPMNKCFILIGYFLFMMKYRQLFSVKSDL